MAPSGDGILVGLDLGGSAARCLVLDVASGETAAARSAFAMRPAPGTGSLGYDLDLEEVTDALGRAVGAALAAGGHRAEDVRGVAATSMRMGSVVLDDAGEVLLAVPNRDARAVGPGLMLGAEHGEALHARTGRWPYPIYAAPRLRWLADQDPERFARAAHLLSLSDWITWRLCGRALADACQAGESLLLDLAERRWMDDWIERLELPRRLFPELAEPGSLAGALGEDAAARIGLPAGTPVAVGGPDTQCALLGAGVLAPGEAAIVAGTTAPVQRVLDEPRIDPEQRVWSGQHLVPGLRVLESNPGPLGDSLEWFARVLFPESPEPVGRLLAEASDAAPGAAGLLSRLGVDVMNDRARGMPVGGLHLNHLSSERDPAPRRHLVRAVVEGMACGLRANLEQLSRVCGAPPTRVRLAGGLSRSPTFAGILADVLGTPVEVSAVVEASGLGAALCAGVGAGVFPDLAAAAEAAVPAATVVAPRPEHAQANTRLYEEWTRVAEAAQPGDAVAAQLAPPWVLQANAGDAASAGATARPRVLVTAGFDDESLAALEELGEVEYAPFRKAGRMLKEESLVEALQDFDVFVTEIDLVDAASLEKLPRLRVVASCRGDAVNVDVAACSAFGIPMLRTPGRNADAVADLTLAFLLMLARKLAGATAFLREPGEAGDMARMGQAFVRFNGNELWRKTVGLVGLGAVGRKVAERLLPFGARVLVADPYVDAEAAARVGARLVPLDALLAESDFVSLHAAVSDETRGLLGAGELARMKEGAALVNTARAALLDEAALCDALGRGHLAGAALDTFAVEPPGSDDPLLRLDSVIATPHIGGNTAEVQAHQGRIVVEGLRALLRGEVPASAANPATAAAFDWRQPRPTPSAEVLEGLKGGPAPAVTDLQRDRKRSS